MRIAVIHNAVGRADALDERDVLVQAETVSDALRELGCEAKTFQCGLNLEAIRGRIETFGPDLVFNLVESLDGRGRLIHLFPYLLDALGLPYTGSPAEAILTTSNKIRAKEHMVAMGIPTPQWVCLPASSQGLTSVGGREREVSETPWIVKSVWEHGSMGLDESALAEPRSLEELHALLREASSRLGGDCFAERFIDGREFNLSLLGGADGPEVLPPAEIVFEGYAKDKPRIVDYRAKWEHDSFEFQHTPRRFDFGFEDDALIEKLVRLARKCWQDVNLAGYARVDFRVDLSGGVWVLEINTNPCLSPDAGFVAALNRAGLPFREAVQRILEEALRSPPVPGCGRKRV
jgi:D-alanine-D-alanine ligase